MRRSLRRVREHILGALPARLVWHERHQLRILTYHAVVRTRLEVYNTCFLDEESFRRQVRYLRRHVQVLPLSEAVERLQAGRITRPTAAITFDDGFQNNYDVAFPILHDAGLPATIFPVTGLVDTDDTTWFCRLHRAVTETRATSLEWAGQRIELGGAGGRADALSAINERLKTLPQQRLQTEVGHVIGKLGDDPDRPVENGSPFRMLSAAAIKEMTASGLIELGAHSHSHAILSLLSAEERETEIRQSVTIIRELTGRRCRLFAYPNGRAQDYDAAAIAALETCGVHASVTAVGGFNDRTTPVMELRRTSVGAKLSLEGFKRKLRG